VGPLEQQIAELLETPAKAPDEHLVRGDGHPPNAEMRLLLAGLSAEQRDEFLFAKVVALGSAMRRIAQAIDELQPPSESD
jgi:hypothetical protein